MLLLAGERMYLLKLYIKASCVNRLSPTNEPCRVLLMIFELKITMMLKFYGTKPSYKNAQRVGLGAGPLNLACGGGPPTHIVF